MMICVETEFDGHPGGITDKGPSALIVWFSPVSHAHESLNYFDAFPRFLECAETEILGQSLNSSKLFWHEKFAARHAENGEEEGTSVTDVCRSVQGGIEEIDEWIETEKYHFEQVGDLREGENIFFDWIGNWSGILVKTRTEKGKVTKSDGGNMIISIITMIVSLVIVGGDGRQRGDNRRREPWRY